MKLSIITAGILVAIMYLASGIPSADLGAQTSAGQAPTAEPPAVPEWQAAAGGKMAFEVASVRPSTGRFVGMNFDWAEGAPYPPNGGYFSANSTLLGYIGFAYNLSQTPDQDRFTLEGQPKWVDSQYFAIQARAPGNSTRDQMRLMMQSLLAERFKLAVHFESPETPVLAMTLIRPGKTGPRLRPHSEGPPCDYHGAPSTQSKSAMEIEVFPPVCGTFYTTRDPTGHLRVMGARNVTMEAIATGLTIAEPLGRPVVDQTGLSGNFDFRIEWAPAPRGSQLPGVEDQSDFSGAPFGEALKKQLGIKLAKRNAPVRVLVIDHVEKPSEN